MTSRARVAWVLREYPFADPNGQNSWLASLVQSVASAGLVSYLLTADARGVPVLVKDSRLYSPHLMRIGLSTSVLAPWPAAKRVAWETYRRSPHRLQAELAAARRAARSATGTDHQLGRPWSAIETSWLQERLRRLDPDVVIFDCPFSLIGGTGRAARLVIAHDILSLRAASLLSMGYQVRPRLDEAWEVARLREADAAVAIQWEDAEWISRHTDLPVVTAPPTFPWRGTPSEGHQVLVVASGSLHNVDGVGWLIREVWPAVAAVDPAARLRIVGTVCSQLEPLPGVDLIGEVADLRAEYARSALTVVPLRVGSGLKVKLAEAISHGRAVVTTTVGAQGLRHLSAPPFLIADSADDFASGVVRLLADPEERQRLESAARTTHERLFDPSLAHSAMLQLITSLACTAR